MSDANELANSQNPSSQIMKDTRGLIESSGEYAKKNKLPSCMSFSIYCVLGYLICIMVILIWPLEFIEKVIGIVVITGVIILIIWMTFKIHKEELQIRHRYKKD